MNKFQTFLHQFGFLFLPEKWIAKDKQMHAAGGIAITFICITLGIAFFQGVNNINTKLEIIYSIVGIAITYFASYYKEKKDAKRGKKFDWADIRAGLYGSIAFAVIFNLIRYF